MPSSIRPVPGAWRRCEGLISGAAAAGRVTAIRLKMAIARQRESHLQRSGRPNYLSLSLLNGVRDQGPALLPLRSVAIAVKTKQRVQTTFYLASCVPSLRTQHNIPRLPANHSMGNAELDAAQHLLAELAIRKIRRSRQIVRALDRRSRSAAASSDWHRPRFRAAAHGYRYAFPSARRRGPRYPLLYGADFAAEISANPCPVANSWVQPAASTRILRRAGARCRGWPIAA